MLGVCKRRGQWGVTSASEVFYTFSQKVKISFGANVFTRLTISGCGTGWGSAYKILTEKKCPSKWAFFYHVAVVYLANNCHIRRE